MPEKSNKNYTGPVENNTFFHENRSIVHFFVKEIFNDIFRSAGSSRTRLCGKEEQNGTEQNLGAWTLTFFP